MIINKLILSNNLNNIILAIQLILNKKIIHIEPIDINEWSIKFEDIFLINFKIMVSGKHLFYNLRFDIEEDSYNISINEYKINKDFLHIYQTGTFLDIGKYIEVNFTNKKMFNKIDKILNDNREIIEF